MGKRVTVGDVFEIPTSRGLAYAQCSHIHRTHGHLIRVLPGFYEKRPKDLEGIVNQKERFVVFFALQIAVNQGMFEFVGHIEVPEEARRFPLFRAGVENRVTKKVKNWWLWDGEKEWMVGAITDAQRELPLREAWSAPLLIERIEQGWHPAMDPG